MAKYVDGTKHFNTVKDAKNTAEYVVARLVDLGIMHSFSVPGDFAFAIDHALINNPKLQNIINANELNGSYAADGYARVRGAAILSTTYAVGELSAINGVMGSKAENNIVFHLVGFPNDHAVGKRLKVHHTLGDGEFDGFKTLSEAATCVSATIRPDNAVSEMNRIIHDAFKYRQPAYISLSLENGYRPVTDTTPEKNFEGIKSVPKQLDSAVNLVLKRLENQKKVVAIFSIKLRRFDRIEKALKLIEALDIPFIIMAGDKGAVSEAHPKYAGLYAGLLSDPMTAEILHDAELILNLGDALFTDFSTGGFTGHPDMSKVINLAPFFVEDDHNYITNVCIGELLDVLIKKVKPIAYSPAYIRPTFKPMAVTDKALTLKSFYHQLVHFLRGDDILVVETGSSSLNIPKLPLPFGIQYHNQTLWGSIGWATPAALGTALASPKVRTILVTGEGSHQLTLNEIGVMGRYEVNPIIFVINNNGYMVERALELDTTPSYDDLAQLEYAKLPEAFGCKGWLSFKVTTEQELADALLKARNHPKGVYIELVTGKFDFGSSLEFYHQHLKDMYE